MPWSAWVLEFQVRLPINTSNNLTFTDVNSDADGSNALRCAALENQWDLVLEIIDTGVDVNAPLRGASSISSSLRFTGAVSWDF